MLSTKVDFPFHFNACVCWSGYVLCTHGDQRITTGDQFFPPTAWGLEGSNLLSSFDDRHLYPQRSLYPAPKNKLLKASEKGLLATFLVAVTDYQRQHEERGLI